nr:MAG TPA: hypothetical protein [Caudoviricetes sp.]
MSCVCALSLLDCWLHKMGRVSTDERSGFV